MVVFNTAAKKMQRNRAAVAEDSREYDYLRDEIAKRLVDRLDDITRKFPVALDLGAYSGNVLKALEGRGGIKTLHMLEPAERMLMRDAGEWAKWAPEVQAVPHVGALEGAPLPFETGSLDAVLSSAALQWVNDLPGVLAEVKRVLKPDGVFLAAMLGGETAEELRMAMVAAEMERDGGVSPHTSPMAHMADVGNLIAGAGFGLPTVDSDIFTIEYPSPAAVFTHMRGMGDSNASLGMRGGGRRDTLLAAAAAYSGMHGNPDGSVPVTYQVIYAVGWAPAAGQPQPKARGSVPKGFGMRAGATPAIASTSTTSGGA